jgi:hypothetical protein
MHIKIKYFFKESEFLSTLVYSLKLIFFYILEPFEKVFENEEDILSWELSAFIPFKVFDNHESSFKDQF